MAFSRSGVLKVAWPIRLGLIMGLFYLSSSGASRGVDPFRVQHPALHPAAWWFAWLEFMARPRRIVGGGTIAQSVLRHDALDKFGRFGESSWGQCKRHAGSKRIWPATNSRPTRPPTALAPAS